MRPERQRHMMMPTEPRAGLIMVHADLALAFLKSRLHRPAQSAEPYEFTRGTRRGRVTHIVLHFRPVLERAAEHDPLARSRQGLADQRHAGEGKLGDHGSLRPFFDLVGMPSAVREVLEPFAQLTRFGRRGRQTGPGAYMPQQARPRRIDPRRPFPGARVRRHFDQVQLAQGVDAIQKARILAEMLIRRDPAKGQDRQRRQVFQHLQSQSRFRLERQVIGNAAALPSRVVIGGKPTLVHVQTLIDKREALGADIDQEHALLAIGDLAQMAAILARDAHRVIALFGEPTTVDHDDGLRVAQPRVDQFLALTNHRFGTPLRLSDEMLQRPHRVAVRPVQAQHHRLNGLAHQVRQLPAQVKQRPPLLFLSLEHGHEQAMIRNQLVRAARDISRGQSVRRLAPAGRWNPLRADQALPALGRLDHGDLLVASVAIECRPENLVVI